MRKPWTWPWLEGYAGCNGSFTLNALSLSRRAEAKAGGQGFREAEVGALVVEVSAWSTCGLLSLRLLQCCWLQCSVTLSQCFLTFSCNC